MLPEILSNNLCSLRPSEDKYTIVAEILIGNDGKIKTYKFYNALINSSARLTYNQVDEYLNNKKIKSSHKVKTEDQIDLFNFDFKEKIVQKKIKFKPSTEII